MIAIGVVMTGMGLVMTAIGAVMTGTKLVMTATRYSLKNLLFFRGILHLKKNSPLTIRYIVQKVSLIQHE